MRFMLRLIMALLTLACLSPAWARSDYIDSAIAAISSANAQAKLGLKKGWYKATSGSTDFIIEIPSDMTSTLKFDYRSRILLSALWEFEREIFATLRVADKCVTISIKKLTYGEGGFLTGGNSDIIPSGPCRESEPLSRLNDFLRLSADPALFFSGSAFVSIGKIKRCTNASCTTLQDGIPIRRVDFYGSIGPDGTPLPAFRAAFEEGSRIILPKNGMLAIGPNSEAVFNDLSYDLEAKSGSALLKRFNVTLTEGIISAGNTILKIKPVSRLTAEEVKIEKDDLSFDIKRGSLSGELGEGTSVILTSNQDKTSTLNIHYAKASFTGINYKGTSAQSSLSIQRGILTTQLENGELWFSERNSVRLGYTNINLILGCPEPVPSDCRPVSWSSNQLSVYGTVNAFSTTLIGGQFNIAEVGTVQLRTGQIMADTLAIDSTDTISPVTGKVNKFEISLEGQNLYFDRSTVAKLSQAEIKGYDLIYKKGQKFPIGSVKLVASSSGIEGGNIGKVKFDAGAQLELEVRRQDGDEPEIVNGAIRGEAKVAMDGGNFVRTKIDVDGIRYYNGFGDAQLKLTAVEGAYTFVTPSAHDSKSELGFEAQIDVKSITLTPTLAQPLVLGPTALKASHRSWMIDPLTGIPFKLVLPIAEQELVYAPIKTPVGGTLCAPKVNLHSQTPNITGKLDVFGSSLGGKVKVYDNALSAGIDAQADDRGCDKIGALVCFLIGTAFGGPIGGAGLAVLCASDINQAKSDLSDTIRNESMRKVSESRFQFDF
ncbi:hypothetical protein IYY11_02135 [Methylocystis sp. H62]|nr:hypothetical protein [Methylocystis sp. H62]